MLKEFHQKAFSKNYTDFETLKTHLNSWLEDYNNERRHQGKVCENKPIKTIEEGKIICGKNDSLNLF
jgi:hypothetical protein